MVGRDRTDELRLYLLVRRTKCRHRRFFVINFFLYNLCKKPKLIKNNLSDILTFQANKYKEQN